MELCHALNMCELVLLMHVHIYMCVQLPARGPFVRRLVLCQGGWGGCLFSESLLTSGGRMMPWSLARALPACPGAGLQALSGVGPLRCTGRVLWALPACPGAGAAGPEWGGALRCTGRLLGLPGLFFVLCILLTPDKRFLFPH